MKLINLNAVVTILGWPTDQFVSFFEVESFCIHYRFHALMRLRLLILILWFDWWDNDEFEGFIDFLKFVCVMKCVCVAMKLSRNPSRKQKWGSIFKAINLWRGWTSKFFWLNKIEACNDPKTEKIFASFSLSLKIRKW